VAGLVGVLSKDADIDPDRYEMGGSFAIPVRASGSTEGLLWLFLSQSSYTSAEDYGEGLRYPLDGGVQVVLQPADDPHPPLRT
jgi:hypothetical protein